MRKMLARDGVVISKDTMYAAITKLSLNCKNHRQHRDTKLLGMIITENWLILSFYIRDKREKEEDKKILY